MGGAFPAHLRIHLLDAFVHSPLHYSRIFGSVGDALGYSLGQKEMTKPFLKLVAFSAVLGIIGSALVIPWFTIFPTIILILSIHALSRPEILLSQNFHSSGRIPESREELASMRRERLQALAQAYEAEDPIDGTEFDIAVFDAFDALKAEFCEPNVLTGEYPSSIVLIRYRDAETFKDPNGGIDRS